MFIPWLQRRFVRTHRPPRYRPRVEALETRNLLTATSTALTSSLNPALIGQSFTLTATITGGDFAAGALGGTVTFTEGAKTLGVVRPAADGAPNHESVAQLTLSLAAGSHFLVASYSGESILFFKNDPSSGAVIQQVNELTSSTTLTVSPNPALVGQSVTFTATVAGVPPLPPGTGTPTGTVTFLDNGSPVGSAPVNGSGTATFSSVLPGGTQSLTAQYSGDGTFNGSTSAPVTQQVNRISTTTTLVSSFATSVVGQTVTFTGTVTPNVMGMGQPTGSITFLDGSTALGAAVPIDGAGIARFSISTLTLGPHSITAVYSGDATFNTSSSPSIVQQVNNANTFTVTLVSPLNPTVFGQAATFTATVTSLLPGAGSPTGAVTFNDGGTALLTEPLNANGQASFTTTTLTTGAHPITAAYSSDPNFIASTSPTLTQQVNKAGTTVTLMSSLTPAMLGQSVTLTATVAAMSPGAGTPTGTVTFFDNGNSIGTGTLNSLDLATFTTTTLTAGTHMLTAQYGGDNNFTLSTSAALAQAITQAASMTMLTSSPNPAMFGDTVTIAATVTAPTAGLPVPTGSVAFFADGSMLGTVTLDGAGQAMLSISTLSLGSHVLTAQYGGDTNFLASSATSLTQQINKRTILARSFFPGAHAAAVVQVFASNGVTQLFQVPLTSVPFRNGVRFTTLGDVNNDGVNDLILVPQRAGKPPLVQVYSGATGALLFSFLAFSANQHGRMLVGVADVNSDGFADILLQMTVGGRTSRRVLSGRDLARLDSLFRSDIVFV
jgi:hypothetical protein